jgi:hypothetical protein
VVGSANYELELESSSRTITVRGCHVASVEVGANVPSSRTVQANARIQHRSCLALADSGGAISRINAATLLIIERRCHDVHLYESDRTFLTFNNQVGMCRYDNPSFTRHAIREGEIIFRE